MGDKVGDKVGKVGDRVGEKDLLSNGKKRERWRSIRDMIHNKIRKSSSYYMNNNNKKELTVTRWDHPYPS